MTTPHSARTAAACRIARIDRQKLTDAIASGDYPCAPPTSAGVARVFNTPALIALYTFARLTEDGLPGKLAGKTACLIQDALQAKPDADFVTITKPIMGAERIGFVPADAACTHADARPIRSFTVYPIAHVREQVLQGLAEEAGIVGGE